MGTTIIGNAFTTGTITPGSLLSYINIPQAGIWLITSTLQLNYTGTLVGYYGFGGAISSPGVGLAMEVAGASSASASTVVSLNVSYISLSVSFSGASSVTIDGNSSFKATRIG